MEASIDIHAIREDISNEESSIFLNSAGSSLMPISVVDKINTYLQEELKFGGYSVASKQEALLSEFYSEAAKLINCNANNIAFTSSATDSFSKVLMSIPFKKNDIIITTDDDYASNHIQFISLKRRYGIEIIRIKNLHNGDLDIDSFKNILAKQTPKLVAISHIPTSSGLIQDVEGIGDICNQHNVLFLLDACQSVGQINVDVNKLKCDFLTATGRKFLRGPRGTGFLYVSDKALNTGIYPLMIDLKGAKWTNEEDFTITKSAKRFESWESSCALKIGLTEAIKYANTIGIKNIETYNKQIAHKLRENLTKNSSLQLLDYGSRKCNIITFHKKDSSLEDIQNKLAANKITYSTIHKSSSLIDFKKKNIEWAIRLSPHYFNTIEEINRVSEIIDSF